MLREFRLRLRALVHRRQLDRDLQDELAYHLEMRRSASPRVAFGNQTLIREELRDMWSVTVIEDLWRDVRYAARLLVRNPRNTLAITLLLAVGIGANAAIFSLAYPILIERLPLADPDRLVSFHGFSAQRGRSEIWGWSTPVFTSFQQSFRSLEVAAAGGVAASAGADARFEGLDTTLATGNYFPLLGLQPASGRLLTTQDDEFENPAAVFVLSHAAWRNRLGGDPSAIGRKFSLFGREFTLVGVTPAKFRGMGGDIWIPFGWQPTVGDRDVRRDPGRVWLEMTGRLKPGASRQQAQTEARAIWDQLKPQYRLPPGEVLELQRTDRGFNDLRDRFATPLRVLAGGVAMLLLIACANVASLLLARAGARQKEIAVRQAIGGGRARLIRQFLVESLLLACCGGALGLALAVAGARALVAMAAPESLEALDPGLNGSVVLFTLGVSLVSAILFGMVPAWRASDLSIETLLKSATRSAAGSRSRHLLNRACLVAQTALSVVLVIGAVLFGESLARLYSVDAGFERKQVITATVNSRGLRFAANPDPQYAALADRIIERLSLVPGVTSASVSGTGFLSGTRRTDRFVVEGHEDTSPQTSIRVNDASWNFLETLGVPLLAGRSFSARDNAGAPPVAVVNQSFARQYFPNDTALGKRLWRGASRANPIEIVGVARDSKYNDFREETVPMVYLPEAQDPRNFNQVQLRAQGSLKALLPVVRQAILEVDPRLAPTRIETLEASLDRTLARDILLARLSGLFGILALLVACFGIFGMTSYMVASRTSEIGVRLAIGARPVSVLSEMLRDALKTVVPGIVIGIVGALAAERVIASMLFGSKTNDPVVYGAVALGLLVTAAVAAYAPARSASKVDPIRALRCE